MESEPQRYSLRRDNQLVLLNRQTKKKERRRTRYTERAKVMNSVCIKGSFQCFANTVTAVMVIPIKLIELT